MTIVHGQIESLNKIKETLYQEGIRDLNSIADINEFNKSYDKEKRSVQSQIEQQYVSELEQVIAQKRELKKIHDDLEVQAITKHQSKIERLELKMKLLNMSETNNVLIITYQRIHYLYLYMYSSWLKKQTKHVIDRETNSISKEIERTTTLLNKLTYEKHIIIDQRCAQKLTSLNHTKKVLDSINPIIAGAIGEHKVQKELAKLDDKNVLFNDFSMSFNPPVYNRKEKDKIFSIQIDHLLVTNSGIFVIETKNWSKASLDKFDLRSPVKQIRRTSFALFVVLNSSKNGNVKLKNHHWGDKEVPIRNLVVMINHRPKEKFKFVQIKTLNELNSYVSYFDPIFDHSEVEEIAQYLQAIKDENQFVAKETYKFSEEDKSLITDQKPSTKMSFKEWLKRNPGKGVNEYYSENGI